MRKFIRLALMVAGFTLTTCATIRAADRATPTPLSELSNVSLRGFNVTAVTKDGFSPNYPVDTAMQFIADEGANLVALDWMVEFKDDGTMASGGGFRHPPFEDVRSVIAMAKDLGLSVVLKPHVTDQTGDNRNDPDVATFLPSNFFPAWKAYLVRLGALATENNVDVICIGTELCGLDWRFRDSWVDLIAAVRESFAGQVTYDSMVQQWKVSKDIKDVVFWDKLDFMSCSLYVSLTKDDNASVASLRAKFTNGSIGDIPDTIAHLRSASEKFGKQIMGLEGGYPSVTGGFVYPGSIKPSYSNQTNYDLQKRGIEAYLGMLYENQGTWLKGVCLYGLTPMQMTRHEIEGINFSQSLSVYDKPAAEVIKEYYTLGQ
jgi:hypothetical protein